MAVLSTGTARAANLELDGGLASGPAGPAPAQTTPPRWRSIELFGNAREVEIEHGDAVYRLRQTALGKLILTK